MRDHLPLQSLGESWLHAIEQLDAETLRVPVCKVFDGDGFLTKLRTRRGELEFTIRFGFVDAPEIGQRGGEEARDFLRSQIENRSVDIVILTKSDTGQIVDRFGRIVAVPYLCENGSKTQASIFDRISSWGIVTFSAARNIELEMVLNGWAWVLERYVPDEQYYYALEEARRHRRGIWAHDDNIHPWDFKKTRYREKKDRAIPRQPDLLSTPARTKCPSPTCNGHLVKRSGRFGDFLGCSDFPRCKHSQSL